MHNDPLDHQKEAQRGKRKSLKLRLFNSWKFKTGMTLMSIAAVASIGALATNAALSDQVTMAQISVTGGSLDLTANGGDGPGEAWSGSVSAALTGLAPGDENSGTVVLANNGDLPFTASVTTSGVDASGCFKYYFRETAATGATKAAAFPVNIAGMGTATGSDANAAAFTTAISGVSLQDNTGADLNWEIDDSKTYTITVRMDSTCSTNAATGTIDFTFDATQV